MDLQASQAAAEQRHAEELENARARLQAEQQAASLLTYQLSSSRESSMEEADSLRASLSTAQVMTPPACLVTFGKLQTPRLHSTAKCKMHERNAKCLHYGHVCFSKILKMFTHCMTGGF